MDIIRRAPLVKYGTPGQADLQGIVKGGRFLAIEVKRKGEKPDDDQIKWGRMVTSMGGLYIVAHSTDEVRHALVLNGVINAV